MNLSHGLTNMKFIILFILMIFLTGCEKKYNGSVESLESLMAELPLEDQPLFLKNFGTLAYVSKGESYLEGMNLKEIQEGISKIHKRNLEFLEYKLKQMKNGDKVKISNIEGVLSNPRPPYDYGKLYSKGDITSIIGSNGDVSDNSMKKSIKKEFMSSCYENRRVRNNACSCIWYKIASNNNNKELRTNLVVQSEDFKSFIVKSMKECIYSSNER